MLFLLSTIVWWIAIERSHLSAFYLSFAVSRADPPQACIEQLPCTKVMPQMSSVIHFDILNFNNFSKRFGKRRLKRVHTMRCDRCVDHIRDVKFEMANVITKIIYLQIKSPDNVIFRMNNLRMRIAPYPSMRCLTECVK